MRRRGSNADVQTYLLHNSAAPISGANVSVQWSPVDKGPSASSQGLQQADIANFSAGQPCTVDWCAVFNQYTGQVPLELQTVDFSDPTGAGMVGSLAALIPFGVQRHAENFEIYVQDWRSSGLSRLPIAVQIADGRWLG